MYRINQRIKTAITRLNGAESHLNFALERGHYTKFSLLSARYDMRNARTLLKNIFKEV
jgi:hypothetical protein